MTPVSRFGERLAERLAELETNPVRYLGAVVIALLALAVGSLVWPALMVQALVAILVALGFGWGPGLVAASILWGGTVLLLVPAAADPRDQLNVGLLAAVSLLAVWSGAAERASRLALRRQARQQAALAEMGRRALTTEAPADLVKDAVALTARALDVEFCHYLALQGDGRTLLLEAGVGIEEELVGTTRLDATGDTERSYLLSTWGPPVTEGSDASRALPPPPWLSERGAKAGMRAVVPGDGKRALGVLGVYTRAPNRAFDDRDMQFLEGMSVVISAILVRAAAARALEEQLDVQTSLLRAHDALGEGIVVLDEDHAILANDAFLRLAGMSLDELREQGIRALVPACHLEEGTRETTQGMLAARGGPVPVEVSCTSFRGDHGETRRALIVRDLRERVELEDRLRAAGDRATKEASHLAGVLTAIPVAVTIADETGRILTANPATRALWGEQMPLVEGIAQYGLFKAWYRGTDTLVAPHQWALARALHTGEPVPTQHVVIENFDGERRYVANSAAPVLAPDGRVLGGVAVNVDETREVTALLELEAIKAELEVRVHDRTAELALVNRELEAFSYTVAHDLRGPLRAITGFASAVVTDYGASLPALALEYLGRVQAAASRMDDLIRDLLRLSRVTRTPLDVQRLDLSALARELLETLQQREPDRRVELSITPGIEAEADRDLVQLLLGNLLENAWKFTRGREVGVIEIYTEEADGVPVYVIRDNGIGFDQLFADRIFMPFERLVNSDLFEGSGIGLSIVRRVVDRHSGWIQGEGVPGHGATFRFTLSAPRRSV